MGRAADYRCRFRLCGRPSRGSPSAGLWQGVPIGTVMFQEVAGRRGELLGVGVEHQDAGQQIVGQAGQLAGAAGDRPLRSSPAGQADWGAGAGTAK